MEYVLLILGFVLLIKGADFFVDGSSSVAKLFKVPSIIIGLTVVAFGTSMPEASVSVTAALAGQNSLAISNVLGSNMFNLLVVLGASALMSPVAANKDVISKEFPFSIVITILLAVFCAESVFSNAYQLGRLGGIVLIVLFVIFVFDQVKSALVARAHDEEDREEEKALPIWKIVIFIVGGIAGIVIGGDLVVEAATVIAQNFGFSETFIGLTVVALGTSLPELVTSVVAAKKGENDLALGNVVGSNIFNILLVLGLSAAICPITIESVAMIDMAILIVVSAFGYLLARTKSEVSRKEGFLFILIYIIYFGYIFVR